MLALKKKLGKITVSTLKYIGSSSPKIVGGSLLHVVGPRKGPKGSIYGRFGAKVNFASLAGASSNVA